MSAVAAQSGATPETAQDPFDDLPPPDTERWVASRKAQVVRAVQEGRLSLDQACERYGLSGEEFLGWQRMIDRHGVPGLRVTRLQRYRG
ncbi:MAG: DUF1153 domain-containing protein [Pseudomonadota bacterium]